jgi:hypothetical protein
MRQDNNLTSESRIVAKRCWHRLILPGPLIIIFTNQSTFAISFGAAIAAPVSGGKGMPTQRHYFIEQTKDGRYTIRAAGSIRASFVFETQQEAFEYAAKLNPSNHRDVERIGNVASAGRGEWRGRA